MLLPLFLRWHGHPLVAPLLGLRAGVAVAAVAYLFYPQVTSAPLLYVLTVVEGLDTVWETCVHALVSLLVTDGAQGRAFGGLSFLRTAINLLGPTVCNSIWAVSVSTDPGVCFYVFSAVSFVSLGAASVLGPMVLRDGSLLEEAERQKAAMALPGQSDEADGGGCDRGELRAALLPA